MITPAALNRSSPFVFRNRSYRTRRYKNPGRQLQYLALAILSEQRDNF